MRRVRIRQSVKPYFLQAGIGGKTRGKDIAVDRLTDYINSFISYVFYRVSLVPNPSRSALTDS